MITVGAIDDDRMLLEMLKNWMAAVPDIQLIDTAATVDEYLQLGVTNEIVLLDLNLKDDSSPAEKCYTANPVRRQSPRRLDYRRPKICHRYARGRGRRLSH